MIFMSWSPELLFLSPSASRFCLWFGILSCIAWVLVYNLSGGGVYTIGIRYTRVKPYSSDNASCRAILIDRRRTYQQNSSWQCLHTFTCILGVNFVFAITYKNSKIITGYLCILFPQKKVFTSTHFCNWLTHN